MKLDYEEILKKANCYYSDKQREKVDAGFAKHQIIVSNQVKCVLRALIEAINED